MGFKMNISRTKKCELENLSSRSSTKILTKENYKLPLTFTIIFLISLALLMTITLSGFVYNSQAKEGKRAVADDEIRLTPQDFLFGLDKNHPIVHAVNDMTYDVLQGNRMTVKVPIKVKNKVVEKTFTFTTPSRIKEKDSHLDYAGKSWLWDSCFHAMILSEKEPEIAKKELRSVCSHQREDGFIPHMNYWSGDGEVPPKWAKEKGLHKFWSKPYSSDITQPPILALALEEIYNKTNDTAVRLTFLKSKLTI